MPEVSMRPGGRRAKADQRRSDRFLPSPVRAVTRARESTPGARRERFTNSTTLRRKRDVAATPNGAAVREVIWSNISRGEIPAASSDETKAPPLTPT
jgi:hypothetical protein